VTLKRICILGSSYIGAIYCAFRTHKPAVDRYHMDFYGHSNGGFPNVDIVDGHIRNVRFKSLGRTDDINSYDAFFIYADLPTPHEMSKATGQCSAMGCSQQVIDAVARDIIQLKTSFRLANMMASSTKKPVFMLSRNVDLVSKTKMHDARYAYNVSVIERAIAPHTYVPFPRNLFDDRLLPNQIYYTGSVALTGERPAANESGHDNNHMNEGGGLLVLNAIVDHLDRQFMAGTGTSTKSVSH
jgi:hypothetical protein